ncbi:flagellar hook-associated protein FlgK [Nesterenkonia populi]|uniref:flagellar hook-associated protein FlgK n=1 Tax=Nesterenkonia populi TaxID=1591087 RepID=UPI0011BE4923|nr:flagellar hook-associated protein FlgK [Nesterenkonia populi]
MSTFSGLNTAWTGLTAAQRGLETAGQNIANVNTEGYTRQRVETAAAGAPAQVGRLSLSGGQAGSGVTVTDIARLNDAQLDARVRSTAAAAGQSSAAAQGLSQIEDILREPGQGGLSELLSEYWQSWEEVAAEPGGQPPAAVLIANGQAAADRLNRMHGELTSQYSSQYSVLTSHVDEVNSAAASVAELNRQISTQQAAGGSANELMDQRDQLTTRIAELTGAEVRTSPNGTADVLIGGTALVEGSSSRSLEVSGTGRLSDAETPGITWAHRSAGADAVSITGGEIAGGLTLLGSAEDGGRIASAAAAMDAIAVDLAGRVNSAQAAGVTVSGEPGAAFFTLDDDNPAASLNVAVTDAAQLATGTAGQGPLDGSNAARIVEFGEAPGGPDEMWRTFAAQVGADVRQASSASVNASTAHVSATEAQRSHSGVSLDEENMALLTHQHAYQGAARVMTAVDQMLDTLINRTGVVGR